MILVTGGAGYIGSHCVLALLEKGYQVRIFDNFSTGHKKITAILSQFGHLEVVQGDLNNTQDLANAFDLGGIEAVIHFAAFSQVAESVENPGKYYHNNVSGTVNLLNAMMMHDVKKIVFSSTAATYGEPEYIPIDEKHPQNPINVYGRTKLMIEQIMDDYDVAYNLKSVRLRYFNVAGADGKCRIGEWHDPETHLIPNILKSVCLTGRTFNMFGADYDTRDGTCIRDYINVEDLARAHLLALEYLQKGGDTDFFNLGTNKGNTVREVFTSCEQITGKKINLEVKSRRAGDPASLVADNTKAKKILGWSPEKSLDDSIRSAYIWEQKLATLLRECFLRTKSV